jgi:hypothetical protein
MHTVSLHAVPMVPIWYPFPHVVHAWHVKAALVMPQRPRLSGSALAAHSSLRVVASNPVVNSSPSHPRSSS